MAAAHTAQKLAKPAVKYTDHGTEAEHCAICVHFMPPRSCGVVAGTIAPRGWCSRFRRRKK
jgi:hypothetical protein